MIAKWIVAVAAFFLAVPVWAQGGAQQYDVQMKSTKVGKNLWVMEGTCTCPPNATGGRMGVLAGPDGVFLVDTQYAAVTPKVLAAIKAISPNPIKMAVVTHVHPDHSQGIENMAKAGVTVITRDEVRTRLAAPAANGRTAPAQALPVITYEGSMTIHFNGETIKLIPVPQAHTDGDTLVIFPDEDVIMTGDFYRSIQFPNIDRANGGSLEGLLAGLAEVIGNAGPNTKIATGHGPVVTRKEVVEHRDMVLAVRDKVAKLIAEGKTETETVAANPGGEFEAHIQEVGTTKDRFIQQVYQELKAK